MLLHHMVKEKMHLQENTLFDLDLGGQGHPKCCPVPQHHVTYAPAKFGIATFHGKEKMHLQENTLFELDLPV